MAAEDYCSTSSVSGSQMNILLSEFRNVYEDKLNTLNQAELLGQNVNAVSTNTTTSICF